MIRALVIGQATERIGVATGITYAFTRAPLAMAAAAADIQEALGGRFALGIGAGTQGMRHRWYDIQEFDRPATRLAEYAALMRAAWSADRELRFDGQFYSAAYPDVDWPRQPVPVWGSGINHAMLRVAARAFEGVALHPLGSNLAYLKEVVVPAVEEGAQGRAERPDLALWRVTSIDADGALARARARKSLAFYFSTPSYGTVAEVAGWGEVAEAIRAGYRESGPQWDEHGALVPDAMVDDFCLAGTPGDVREQWDRLEPALSAAGATEVVFQTVTGAKGTRETVDNLMAITDALAPRAGA
jgi:alkanesulfonate monooxygenase SsuD/methylene tetrahydromethanopterin reductase-like flavin-dependent oxidoreductase (luciferase family)